MCPIDETLTVTTTLGQSGPGSNDNKRVLHIISNSKTEASPSDGLASYTTQSLEAEKVSYLLAEMQSVYFSAPVDWIHRV